jgi:CopG family nickel-responsive transcriptional regulator
MRGRGSANQRKNLGLRGFPLDNPRTIADKVLPVEVRIMSGTVRFSVSLGDELLKQFDRSWRAEGLPTRSEAVKAMIRQTLIQKEWLTGKEVAGAIVLVYDHQEKPLANQLINVQHDFEDTVVSTQHVHLDHDNCLESIIVDGKAQVVGQLVKKLKSIKGLKHMALMMTTTGKAVG